MALSSLFARRPDVQDPATWTPEGTTVVQRYRALEGATVLVYTADADTVRPRYATACLGCSYREAVTGAGWFTEDDAGRDANAHASTCRALPRGLLGRPDDDTAEAMIRAQVENKRETIKARTVYLADFLGVRVDLQRSTELHAFGCYQASVRSHVSPARSHRRPSRP